MRIIGGSLGGRRIRAPAGDATRPTAERVRESLFSILGSPPEHTRVLDVFAGAGTLGLEALSRGAEHVVFLERAEAAVRCLRQNIDALGLRDSSRVQRGDALRALERMTGAFCWVFVDPPYRSDLAAGVLQILGRGRLLTEDAVIVIEHDRRLEPDSRNGCLVRTDLRRYGDTSLSFYQQGEA
jgi:16S rRNA (guanine(966)-N(2))-methyltransferase RsmD